MLAYAGGMKWIVTIISNLAVAGVVAFLCFGSATVEAQPSGGRFEEGYQVGYATGYEQGYVDHVEYREVVTYVDREVVREVVVNRTPSLRDFVSLEELETWLALDDTDEFVFFFADESGNAVPSDRYDCDDYARQLQQRAAASGFHLSLNIVGTGAGRHMVNLAVIGDSVFHVEPQTDAYRYYCKLD